MAKKPTIASISSGYQGTATLNADLQALREAFDNTLSLDGSTPNSMEADLDLNSNDLINAGTVYTNAISVSGVDFTDLLEATVDAADADIASASLAGASETASAGYATEASDSASEAALSASTALSATEPE